MAWAMLLQGNYFKPSYCSAPDRHLPISAIDVDTWNLEQLEVHREWKNIDILLRDDLNRLVVIIENKIGSTEHSDQLQRYWRTVEDNYPEYCKLGVYVTPDNDRPTDDHYVPIGYEAITTVLERLLKRNNPSLGPGLANIIKQYVQMLRRHVMSESDIARLCRQIYRRHKPAIDLIIQNLPDRQAVLKEFLEALIRETPALSHDDSTKSYIRFAPREWEVDVLRAGNGWTSTGRILLFEFGNDKESLNLKLTIGPGPKEIRQTLLDLALGDRNLFQPTMKALGRSWNTIFSRSFLSKRIYSDATDQRALRGNQEMLGAVSTKRLAKAA